MNKDRYLAIIYIVSSSLLLYLSFPNIFYLYGFWPLAWIGLVPYFMALDENPLAERLKIGVLFSFLFFAFLVSWVLSINFLGYLAFIIVLAIGPILFSALCTHSFNNRFIDLLYFPCAWVTSEFIRACILGGFSWTLGHSQTFYTQAIQLANVTGAYGVSFVLVLFNYCLFRILKEYEDRYFYSIAAIVALFGLFLYGYNSMVSDQLKSEPKNMYQLGAIQPNISPQEKWDKSMINPVVDKHIALTQECLKSQRPDMVIWPETSIPDDFIRDEEMRDKISRISQEVKTHLLLGAALLENDRDYNSAVLLNGRGAVLDIYRKKYLVPFSEYLPLKQYLSFLRDSFNFNIYGFYPGTRPGIFTLRKKTEGGDFVEQNFGVALCSEGAYPFLFRNLVDKGSGFIILMLNDAWFKQEAAMMVHAQNEVMRAAENRVPIVRVANSGLTCSIDQYGRVKTTSEGRPKLNKAGFYVYHIYPNNEKTFYNEYGDIFSVLCVLFVIICLVLKLLFSIRLEKRET